MLFSQQDNYETIFESRSALLVGAMTKPGRKPIHERDALMAAALTVARREGYRQMSREAIATECKCSPALISKYFGTMPQLRRSVMRAAVVRGDHAVIAQGLAAGDPNAHEATAKAKRDALEGLLV